ncbi:hypothetical protein BX589_12123 [Paraburkholderia fungorum]|jgi:hypothetical protein|nr:hypothetical protein BX589_12123 [Paraburkholderia fungorum]
MTRMNVTDWKWTSKTSPLRPTAGWRPDGDPNAMPRPGLNSLMTDIPDKGLRQR